MNTLKKRKEDVVIAGGGINGVLSSIALKRRGFNVTLLERGNSLLSGASRIPLHAHLGMLYSRSEQSIKDTMTDTIGFFKMLPQIATPCPTAYLGSKHSEISWEDSVVCFERVREQYRSMVDLDPSNMLFGSPNDFLTLYTVDELKVLKESGAAKESGKSSSHDNWARNFAQKADLDNIEGMALCDEPGLNMVRAGGALLDEINELEIPVVTGSNVADVREENGRYKTIFSQGGEVHEVVSDQFVNCLGSSAYTLDRNFFKLTEFLVELKASAYMRLPESMRGVNLPAFYSVFSIEDGKHFEPISGDIVGIIATNDNASGIARHRMSPSEELPQDWKSAIKDEFQNRPNRSFTGASEPELLAEERVRNIVEEIAKIFPDMREATFLKFAPEVMALPNPSKGQSFKDVRKEKIHPNLLTSEGYHSIQPNKLTNSFDCVLKVVEAVEQHAVDQDAISNSDAFKRSLIATDAPDWLRVEGSVSVNSAELYAKNIGHPKDLAKKRFETSCVQQHLLNNSAGKGRSNL